MRCGRQDTKTRKHVRTCMSRPGESVKTCSWRGRERRCPGREPETRSSEIYGEAAVLWASKVKGRKAQQYAFRHEGDE